MADNQSEKVSEEIPEEKVQNQMLPPALPLSTKLSDKKADATKKREKSVGNEGEIQLKIISFLKPLSTSEVEDYSEEVNEKDPLKRDEAKDEISSPKPPSNDGKEKKTEEKISKQENIESEMLPPTLPCDENKKTEKTEQLKKDQYKNDYPELPYTEPLWSGVPQEPYSLELLKGGCIISTKHLTTKSYYLFGRLPNCDMVMEHPSISRYHAIMQYKASDSASGKKGFYLYDLASTHGTKVNKIVIKPKRYYRLQVGYVIKFGGSSRLYILQGPEEMEQDDLPKEMQEAIKPSSEVGKVLTEAEYDEWKKESERKPEETTHEACGWGFDEDAVEEDVVNPFASELEEGMEAYAFKDPKKTLRGYFEREGLDLEYQVEETGPGHARVYHCRIKLPIEDANGDPLYAEATVTGKKREVVLACAEEACRILDMNGLLRQSSHESKKQKLKNWEENDYYDSDEDTFLDRTGSIEKKRLKRIKMAKNEQEEAETFESLSSKLKAVEEEIQSLEDKLEQAVKASKAAEESEDSLESYMKSIDKSMDRTSRMQMRRKIFDLKKEKQKLAKLVKVSRPASLPSLVNTQSPKSLSKDIDVKITKDSNTSTTSASTSDSVNLTETTDPATDTRHEKAEVEDKVAPSADTQILKSNNSPPDGHSGENKSKVKAETFAKPKIPFTQPKPKSMPPSNSISMLLEGLRNSAEQATGKTSKKEKRPRKRSDDHHDDTQQEPVEKKRTLYPQPSPHSPPRSPSPPKTAATEDDDYSEWVPPADQTGDGRTKLNEKYGY